MVRDSKAFHHGGTEDTEESTVAPRPAASGMDDDYACDLKIRSFSRIADTLILI
jgi:hypothetical protein